MRKKKKIINPKVKIESKYNSFLVSKLINKIMKDGKKNKAVNIVYSAAGVLEKETKENNFIEILETAINNIKPEYELVSYKRGASTQRRPVKVNENRALGISLRWLVEGARKLNVNSKEMYENLATEIKEATKKSGNAFSQKQKLEKEVSVNMVFSKIR